MSLKAAKIHDGGWTVLDMVLSGGRIEYDSADDDDDAVDFWVDCPHCHEKIRIEYDFGGNEGAD